MSDIAVGNVAMISVVVVLVEAVPVDDAPVIDIAVGNVAMTSAVVLYAAVCLTCEGC